MTFSDTKYTISVDILKEGYLFVDLEDILKQGK
jgi:hypothetical protein